MDIFIKPFILCLFFQCLVNKMNIALKIISRYYPHQNLGQVIQLLYNNLHKLRPYHPKHHNHHNQKSQFQMILQSQILNQAKLIKAHQLRQQEQSSNNQKKPKFMKEIEQDNKQYFQNHKQTIEIFCAYGYGISILRQHSNKSHLYNSRQNTYKNFITSASTQAIRNLQKYIQLQQRIKITKFTRIQIRQIMNKVIHCHQWMNINILQTFIKFIRIVFKIQTSLPVPQESILLYRSICKIIDKQVDLSFMGEIQYEVVLNKQFGKKNIVFNPQIDRAICQMYIEYHKLAQVKEALTFKFKLKHLQLRMLTIRFFKILRLAYKKIISQSGRIKIHYTLHEFALKQMQFRKMIVSPLGLKVRLSIMKYSIADGLGQNEVRQALKQLHSFKAKIMTQQLSFNVKRQQLKIDQA